MADGILSFALVATSWELEKSRDLRDENWEFSPLQTAFDVATIGYWDKNAVVRGRSWESQSLSIAQYFCSPLWTERRRSRGVAAWQSKVMQLLTEQKSISVLAKSSVCVATAECRPLLRPVYFCLRFGPWQERRLERQVDCWVSKDKTETSLSQQLSVVTGLNCLS